VLATGENDHHIRADALQLVLHQAGRALADRDHRRHRGNADDHAQHRQPRAQLVLRESAESNAKC
jgi:hypothetical protein